jgi:E3 ubiquitin-protein ligase RNF13
VRSGVSDLPASETTPLLSSAVHLPSRSSSFRSSVATSPPRPTSRRPSTQSVSRVYSVSSTPYSPNPLRSYINSPSIGISRSNADLANISSPHPHNSYISSTTHTLLGSHLSPPISIMYSSPHISHSGDGSPTPHVGSSYVSNSGYGSSSYYLGSSSQHRSYLRHCGESGPSLSTLGHQSPHQSQLPHGESETNLAAASSAQSFRQSFLRHCGDSDASLSDMTSAQSLPGC